MLFSEKNIAPLVGDFTRLAGVDWALEPDGWFTNAHRVVSLNQDPRPLGVLIDLLVIHNISLPPGEYGGPWIEALFLNRLDPLAHPYFTAIASLRVSAHLLIRRDGRLVQFVSLLNRAWHAGCSSFEGRCNCNDFSVGIELEGSDHEPFTPAQYQVLNAVTGDIMRRFPGITPSRITGHSHIAPGRKTDPGPYFDWDQYRMALALPLGPTYPEPERVQ